LTGRFTPEEQRLVPGCCTEAPLLEIERASFESGVQRPNNNNNNNRGQVLFLIGAV